MARMPLAWLTRSRRAHRFSITDWSVQGRVMVLDERITEKVLLSILTEGGQLGLGDYRPSCKKPGPFGTFKPTVELIK